MLNGTGTGIGNGIPSRGVPIRFLPYDSSLVFRSNAEIQPQAGCLHGIAKRRKERIQRDAERYAVLWLNTRFCSGNFASFGGSIGLPGPRDQFPETNGSAIGLAIAT